MKRFSLGLLVLTFLTPASFMHGMNGKNNNVPDQTSSSMSSTAWGTRTERTEPLATPIPRETLTLHVIPSAFLTTTAEMSGILILPTRASDTSASNESQTRSTSTPSTPHSTPVLTATTPSTFPRPLSENTPENRRRLIILDRLEDPMTYFRRSQSLPVFEQLRQGRSIVPARSAIAFGPARPLTALEFLSRSRLSAQTDSATRNILTLLLAAIRSTRHVK